MSKAESTASTPKKSAPSTPKKPVIENEISAGSPEMAAFLTSPKVIIGLIIITLIVVGITSYIVNLNDQRILTAWVVVVVSLFFYARHVIGNKK